MVLQVLAVVERGHEEHMSWKGEETYTSNGAGSSVDERCEWKEGWAREGEGAQISGKEAIWTKEGGIGV